MGKIKIGIVDDHQAIAEGVSAGLAKTGNFDVLFIVCDKNEIIARISGHQPEVMIMDVVMPGSMGADTFKEVLNAFPGLKIIAYTALNSPLMIELLLKAGVKGYVSKNQPLEDLVAAIDEVVYDRISLPAEYNFIRKKMNAGAPAEELSKREIEILLLIAAEKKSGEIAETLNISINTVETHRKHLFDKLGVSNLAGLIKAGFDLGYLR